MPVHARSQSRLGVQAGSCSSSTHNVRLPLGLWVQERGGMMTTAAWWQRAAPLCWPRWRPHPPCRYGLKHGAAFGLSHPLTQLAILRPAPRDATIAGLYFVGASAR